MVWYFKAFALTGRQVCDRNYPGRCPGLGASALSGRVGTRWCSDALGVWGLLVKQGVWGLLAKLECILLHASVCCSLFKWFCQLTQVVQSAYSSDSISLLKWFCQLIQVVQSAYSSGSISLLKWLNQTTQVAQSASTAVCVTRYSRILNPTQPYP